MVFLLSLSIFETTKMTVNCSNYHEYFSLSRPLQELLVEIVTVCCAFASHKNASAMHQMRFSSLKCTKNRFRPLFGCRHGWGAFSAPYALSRQGINLHTLSASRSHRCFCSLDCIATYFSTNYKLLLTEHK